MNKLVACYALCSHCRNPPAASATKKAAEQSGRDGANSVKASAYTGMSLEEAKQILNVRELNDLDAVAKVKWNYLYLECAPYRRLFRTMNICLNQMISPLEVHSTFSLK